MKIEMKIDELCAETKIVVVCSKLSAEISDLMRRISEESPQTLIGYSGEFVVPVEQSDIVRIFAEAGKVFAVTEKKSMFCICGCMRLRKNFARTILSEFQIRK